MANGIDETTGQPLPEISIEFGNNGIESILPDTSFINVASDYIGEDGLLGTDKGILPDNSFINVASDYIKSGGAIPAPDQSPIEMIIQMVAPSVTKVANNLGIPVSIEDTKKIAEGIAEGNSRAVLNVLDEKLITAPEELKSQLARKLIAQAGMITTPIGQLNAVNTTLQTGGDYVQNALDALRLKLDPDSIGSNILGRTSNIIEGGQGIFGGLTNNLNRTMGNVVYDPVYGFVNLAGKNVIDPIASRINPLLNLFSKRKSQPEPDPVPVQLTNDQINQIVEDEVNLNPPTPAFSPQDMNIQPAPAPAQPAFSPQDMNIQSYSPPSYVGGGGGGMSYRNVVNRANGGLVSVSRYLKGR